MFLFESFKGLGKKQGEKQEKDVASPIPPQERQVNNNYNVPPQLVSQVQNPFNCVSDLLIPILDEQQAHLHMTFL